MPKSLRDQFNPAAAPERETPAAGGGSKPHKPGAEKSLIRKHGILVHHGSARAAIVIGEFIRAERNVRIRPATGNAG